jgi:prepilin-type N-terminal cleavage/methylation domain-containing protein
LTLARPAGADGIFVNDSHQHRTDRADRGFTMLEILIVIVILGILATVVVFSVRGITDRGEQSACAGDARTLTVAADSWMAQESLDEVPALGTSTDRYELYLVDVGMIRQVSTYWDLHADGTVTSTGDPCP